MNAAFKRIKPGSPLTPDPGPDRELETLALAKKPAPVKPVNRGTWQPEAFNEATIQPEVFK